MRIRIIAVGRMKTGPENALFTDYAGRCAATGKTLGLTWRDTPELDESRAGDATRRKTEEAAAITSRLEARNARLVVLDERGKMTSSKDIAGLIGRWRDDGIGETAFVIGGPDGLDRQLAARADERIAFGRATWPHKLVRAMLAEQLYRAMTILSGHPYHRA